MVRSVRLRPSRGFAALLGLLPLALGACVTHGDEFDLYPIYRNRQDPDSGQFAILWPLSNFEWDEEGETSWSVPFHYHQTRGEHEEMTLAPVIPLYFHQKMLDQETTGFFPLFSSTRTGARSDTTLLVLLAEWGAYQGEDELAALKIFPLFQWEEKGAGERLSLVRGIEIAPTGPLFSLLDMDRTGLSYGAETDEQALAVDFASVFGRIVNLFHWDDEGSHTDTRFLTLFANEDWSLFQRRVPHEGAPGADTGRTILFPLYFDIDHDDELNTTIFWPPYGSTSRGDDTVARYILFPLLRLRDDPVKKVSGFDFLWPLIGQLETEKGRRTWFQPLFSYETFDGGYEWTTILNMFGYGEAGERSRLRLFWIPWEL